MKSHDQTDVINTGNKIYDDGDANLTFEDETIQLEAQNNLNIVDDEISNNDYSDKDLDEISDIKSEPIEDIVVEPLIENTDEVTDASNLSCKQCEFVCEFQTSLKRHFLTFHGDRKYFDSAFKCEICGNGYKSNQGLTTHFSYEHYEHEKTPSKKLCSKLEKESSPKEISAESDKKQKLKKIVEENVEIWDFENTVDSSVQKESNVPNNLPAAQSLSIPENQPKKRNRKQTMAERQNF